MTQPPFKRNGIAHMLANNTTPQPEVPGGVNHEWKDLDPRDLALIHQCVQRVCDLAPPNSGIDKTILAMDIALVHTHGCPLNLLQLLMSSNDDITHDVLGIGLHVDRKTGKLFNGFAPRHRKPYS